MSYVISWCFGSYVNIIRQVGILNMPTRVCCKNELTSMKWKTFIPALSFGEKTAFLSPFMLILLCCDQENIATRWEIFITNQILYHHLPAWRRFVTGGWGSMIIICLVFHFFQGCKYAINVRLEVVFFYDTGVKTRWVIGVFQEVATVSAGRPKAFGTSEVVWQGETSNVSKERKF